MKRIRVSSWTTSLCWSLLATVGLAGNAAAEVQLVETNGWEVFTEGRVGTFGSVALGKDVPLVAPSGDPNVATPQRLVGIFGSDNEQQDTSNNVMASRLRSGMMPNILAFGVKKQLTETTSVRGYISLWASSDTNRVKYTKSAFDVRQGYLKVEGPWGSVLAGRAMALFSRGNFEIDFLYQHGYGFGHPCKIDSSGEEAGFAGGGSCGQIGFGVLHPSYDAGLAYATPSIGGLKLTVGIYDPVGTASTLPRTPYPRPEGELSFERKLGNLGMIKLFASGMWQRSQKVVSNTDPTTQVMTQGLITRDAFGYAGGARVELGPLRIGGSGYAGQGLGTHVALNGTNDITTFNSTTFNYRKANGFHAAVAGVFGRYMLHAGFGMARIVLLPEDSTGAGTTVILPKQQYGISAGFNARISEVLVLNIDYFRAHSEWYDRQSQDMNFVSAGLTLVW